VLLITIVACGGSPAPPTTPSASPTPPAASPAPAPLPSATPSPDPSSTPGGGGGLSLSCQANPRSGIVPLQVAFSSFPAGGAGGYVFEWAFGDGATSPNPNPSHTYAAVGVFDAALRVTSGSETATCSRDIMVTAPPAPGPAPGPSPFPMTATVTITNGGVSPQTVHIRLGGTVRFVNQSSGQHNIQSDPHPIHTECPPLNQVPFLNPGQSGQTGAFTTARTCGFHDHLNPTNGALMGSVVVNP
jgi:plastocyanin